MSLDFFSKYHSIVFIIHLQGFYMAFRMMIVEIVYVRASNGNFCSENIAHLQSIFLIVKPFGNIPLI